MNGKHNMKKITLEFFIDPVDETDPEALKEAVYAFLQEEMDEDILDFKAEDSDEEEDED
jgi:hypothetical protein